MQNESFKLEYFDINDLNFVPNYPVINLPSTFYNQAGLVDSEKKY